MAKAEQVVAQMLALREKRAQLKKQYEEEDRKLRNMMDKGENWLLDHMHETGHESFKAGGATVFTKTNMRYSVPDKDAFANFVRESGEVDLMQFRVSSTNMKEYLDNGHDLPPGVKVDPVVSVNIRKS